MSNTKQEIAIIGAGSWGTALALVLAHNKQCVRLWTYDKEQAQRMHQERRNPLLPKIKLPASIKITADLAEAVKNTRTILLVVPSHAFRSVLRQLKPLITSKMRLAWGTKGIEADTCALCHEVVQQELGKKIPLAVISGPSFALEVAQHIPTAVCVAGNNKNFTRDLAQLFHSSSFRVYQSSDLSGVEICGAVKNVIAIAAGILDGMQLGANTHAALITRGLAEMARLSQAMGGASATVMGLAGLGDLILTCSDNLSRNRRFGQAIGSGLTVTQAQAKVKQVVEGLMNAEQVYQLARHHQVEMPIVEKVYQILYKKLSPKKAIQQLLSRPIAAQ